MVNGIVFVKLEVAKPYKYVVPPAFGFVTAICTDPRFKYNLKIPSNFLSIPSCFIESKISPTLITATSDQFIILFDT